MGSILLVVSLTNSIGIDSLLIIYIYIHKYCSLQKNLVYSHIQSVQYTVVLKYFVCLVIDCYCLFKLITAKSGTKTTMCVHHIFLAAVANIYVYEFMYVYVYICICICYFFWSLTDGSILSVPSITNSRFLIVSVSILRSISDYAQLRQHPVAHLKEGCPNYIKRVNFSVISLNKIKIKFKKIKKQ